MAASSVCRYPRWAVSASKGREKQFGTFSRFEGWYITTTNGDLKMDRDRSEGIMKQASGSVKEAAGKVTGDAKLEAEGKGDKVAGKIQNAVGGVKDTLRGE